MRRPQIKSTFGEYIFASVLSAVAAVFAATAGFVTGILFCEWRFSGEMTEWALVLAPSIALAMAVVAFLIVFRKIIKYGEPTSNQPL